MGQPVECPVQARTYIGCSREFGIVLGQVTVGMAMILAFICSMDQKATYSGLVAVTETGTSRELMCTSPAIWNHSTTSLAVCFHW